MPGEGASGKAEREAMPGDATPGEAGPGDGEARRQSRQGAAGEEAIGSPRVFEGAKTRLDRASRLPARSRSNFWVAHAFEGEAGGLCS